MFKVFYSWESDLPSSKNRAFIRGCIDKAIELADKAETIEAERDEATKGLTGSPDIVTILICLLLMLAFVLQTTTKGKKVQIQTC